jgi:uncharacterized protein (TIGR03437 family)
VPVVSVSPAEVRFQIPWETPTNYYGSSAIAQLVIPGAIFAAAPGTLGLGSFTPVFEGIPCLFPNGLSDVCAVAAHGDFSGLLSGEDPARPGEVIHFYMRGLGPVIPAVATGEAAPDSPLSQVQQGFSCFLYESNRLSGLPILFAGLAPGLVGIYQVSMQLPPQVQTDLPQVICVIDFGIMGNKSATTRIYAAPRGP